MQNKCISQAAYRQGILAVCQTEGSIAINTIMHAVRGQQGICGSAEYFIMMGGRLELWLQLEHPSLHRCERCSLTDNQSSLCRVCKHIQQPGESRSFSGWEEMRGGAVWRHAEPQMCQEWVGALIHTYLLSACMIQVNMPPVVMKSAVKHRYVCVLGELLVISSSTSFCYCTEYTLSIKNTSL